MDDVVGKPVVSRSDGQADTILVPAELVLCHQGVVRLKERNAGVLVAVHLVS